jgi:hypothetical protein
MWNKPTDKQLNALPMLYSTEDTPAEEKIIKMHFFMGGCDWWIAEYSPEERLFYGFALINRDWQSAEWGYINLDELLQIKAGYLEIDRDLHWKPVKFGEIPDVKKNLLMIR